MTKTSRKIVFFGNERLATGVTTTCPTLRALIEADYDIAAVVSNNSVTVSRKNRVLEIEEVAKAHDIPVLLPSRPSEIKDQLRELKAEVGVLAAYGKIVSEEIINLFPAGIVNIHPSLLPMHRGPTPIESAILCGEAKTGVSIMKLVKAMDAGPVFGQTELPLTGKESKQDLVNALSDIGQAMVIELLPGILDGSVVALPQDDSRATYDQLITKDAGIIDWSKPAEQLEREVRAFLDWPGSRTTLAKKDVIITRAHAVPSQAPNAKPGDIDIVSQAGIIMVNTGNGSLCIERLKPAGKNEMTSAAFMAGHKDQLQ